MAQPVPPRPSLLGRVAIVAVVLFVAWLVLQVLLGWVFAFVRTLLFVALFAVIAWVVLVGRGGD
jgi:hypothetical protein